MAKDCYKQAAHAGLIRPQVNLGYIALRCQQYNKALKHFRVRAALRAQRSWVGAGLQSWGDSRQAPAARHLQVSGPAGTWVAQAADIQGHAHLQCSSLKVAEQAGWCAGGS